MTTFIPAGSELLLNDEDLTEIKAFFVVDSGLYLEYI